MSIADQPARLGTRGRDADLAATLAPPDATSSPCCRQRRTLTTSDRSAKRRTPTRLILHTAEARKWCGVKALQSRLQRCVQLRCTAMFELPLPKLNIDLLYWSWPKGLFLLGSSCSCCLLLFRWPAPRGGWGREVGGKGGAPGARPASRGASLGGLCWDCFAGGRLGMPLAHPSSSWPSLRHNITWCPPGPAIGS
jgi:hypothetical protein